MSYLSVNVCYYVHTCLVSANNSETDLDSQPISLENRRISLTIKSWWVGHENS